MNDDYYMRKAIDEANKANKLNEIPVGAVVVDDQGKIIGRGHNKKEKNNKVTSHAEINAILAANKKINNWRLSNCKIYITLEPCEMCKKVIEESRIKEVIYSSDNLYNKESYKPKYIKINNIETENATNALLNDSFKKIRNKDNVSRETCE